MAEHHEPMLIALDPSAERIADLIPDDWEPSLTEMIWRAVSDVD